VLSGIRIKGGREKFDQVVRSSGRGSYRVESRCCSLDFQFSILLLVIQHHLGLV